MRMLEVVSLCALILLAGTPTLAAELDVASRAAVSDWGRERDQAAMQYLRSWLRGEPSRARISAGLTIIAREAGIAAMIRDKDPDFLRRSSCLWGRRVTPETLPVVLLECRGIRFDPVTLFEGRTFSLEAGGQFNKGR